MATVQWNVTTERQNGMAKRQQGNGRLETRHNRLDVKSNETSGTKQNDWPHGDYYGFISNVCIMWTIESTVWIGIKTESHCQRQKCWHLVADVIVNACYVDAWRHTREGL